MKRAIVFFVILVVIAAAAGGGWWFFQHNPDWWFWLQEEANRAIAELGLVPEEAPVGLVASGFVEAQEAAVTTDLGGRIVDLMADEGDAVTEGQVVVLLDDSLLRSQLEIARADLAVAEVSLVRVKAGVREETLDHARALVKQAEAGQEATLVAWQDAQAMRQNPQELELALTAARSQLSVLDYQVAQARAFANAAQVGRNLADEVVGMLADFEPFTVQIPVAPGVIYTKKVKLPSTALPDAQDQQSSAMYQSWQAWTAVSQAEAARAGIQDYVKELSRQLADPVALDAQVNAAESQYKVATAAVELAQAQVDGLQIGATPEQIAAVEAQVEVARAAVDTYQVQLDKVVLRAPITGLVLERPAHVGEVAIPGAPLMTLADLDNLTLTIYIAENQLGTVRVGQEVSVTVDAYPDRTFPGKVSLIANEAEFTPKNVQTREERVNMVFAVKVSLPNPDHALKPGMPADAIIPEAGTGDLGR